MYQYNQSFDAKYDHVDEDVLVDSERHTRCVTWWYDKLGRIRVRMLQRTTFWYKQRFV